MRVNLIVCSGSKRSISDTGDRRFYAIPSDVETRKMKKKINLMKIRFKENSRSATTCKVGFRLYTDQILLETMVDLA